jgi:Tfp pilus assembly protein PilX
MASSQKGSTLVVSTVILILILMMGISAMISSDTQLKLTGNLQYEDVAMNNAEAALAAAEAFLSGSSANSLSAGFTTYTEVTPELYPMASTLAPLRLVWSDTNSRQVADASQRYYIQLVSKNVALLTSGVGVGVRKSAPSSLVNTYLITARGTGARGATKYIQSYYKVRVQ